MTNSPAIPLDIDRIRGELRALSRKELLALAKRAGVGRSTLYSLRIDGARDYRLGTLARIQEALNAPAGAD